jgi:xylose isomerase
MAFFWPSSSDQSRQSLLGGETMERKYAVGLWAWGRLGDRFNLIGYRPGWDVLSAIRMIASIPHVKGIEFTYPDNLNDENKDLVKKELENHGLKVASIYCNISSDPKWQRGAFTANPKLKEEAIKQVCHVMDLAAEFGSDKITFSLLQDGWDYPFQVDYYRARREIIEGLKICCDHRNDVSIGVEFKSREPRTFCFIDSAANTLLLINEVKRDNIGVVVDIGHSLMNRENMSYNIVLLASYGKLLHLHLNDNYRTWDDDLIVGSIHFLETLELIYWLNRVGYKGWYSLDIFPYREDPTQAATESIEFIETCFNILERIGMDKLEELINSGDPVKTLRTIRNIAFNVNK